MGEFGAHTYASGQKLSVVCGMNGGDVFQG